MTVLAGAGADFLKIALTVTAIVCFLLNVDEKRVRYMKITTSDFGKWFTPSSPNFYLEDTKFFFRRFSSLQKEWLLPPARFCDFFCSSDLSRQQYEDMDRVQSKKGTRKKREKSKEILTENVYVLSLCFFI